MMPRPGLGETLADPHADAGMSLLEVLVALSIMSVVMAAATAGLLPMYRLTRDAEAHDQAQSALSVALLRIDRQVRYAVALSVAPDGLSAAYLYVEPGATKRCSGLRWSTVSGVGVLQQRGWAAGTTPGTTWTTLATGLLINRPGYTQPFALIPPTEDVAFQRLQVRLVVAGNSGAAERSSNVTFTALNTATTVNPC